MRLQHWPLRRRLVAVLIGLFAVMASAMALASTVALRDSLVGQLDSRLHAASERAANAPTGPRETVEPGTSSQNGQDSASQSPDERPPGLRQAGQQDVGAINLFEHDGATIAGYFDESGSFQTLTSGQVSELGTLAADGVVRTVALDGLGAYRAVATETPTGSRVVTGLSLTGTTSTVERYLTIEAIVALAGLVLAALAGTALVRRELGGLSKVAATATRVSELPLDRGEVLLAERVEVSERDAGTEIGQVATALNRLLGHVENALGARHASETQVRQFVADASHELRTPLASIRGHAELVRRLPVDLPADALRAMSRVESEALRMTGLVEDMLLLARLDAGRELENAPVDLTALCVDALSDAHAAGPDHVWKLDLGDAEEPLSVPGDEDRLRQVLANLLSNARVHTPAGTTVTLRLRAVGDDVELSVVDDGPGIAEPLRSHLFDRFTRGDAARTNGTGSTGLGLSIVHAVVAAHGGTVAVDGTSGATSFTVTLPCA